MMVLSEERTVVSVFPSADFAVKINGDSMSPIFCDGDMVYFTSASSVVNGEIAAIICDEEVVVRRVYDQEDYTCLCATNPQYMPMRIPSEDLRIVGKVVGLTRTFA